MYFLISKDFIFVYEYQKHENIFLITNAGISIYIILWQKDPDPEKRTKAAFSLTGFENPVPSPIKFINISTNVTSTTWDFGDGGTSTDFNPTHTYNAAGTYYLKLKVTGPTGVDSVCKVLSVENPPAPNKTALFILSGKM
jgi:PKD repeat protein